MKTELLRLLGVIILIILGAIIVGGSSGCGVRHLAKTEVKTEKTIDKASHKDSSGATSVHKIDTSSTAKATITTHTDSSDTKTTFTPIPGTTTTISPDGTIHGQFSNIQSDQTKHSSSTHQSSSSGKKGITMDSTQQSHLMLDSSSHTVAKRDSTTKKVDNNTTLAANIPKWVWIIGLIILVLAGIYVTIRKNLLSKL